MNIVSKQQLDSANEIRLNLLRKEKEFTELIEEAQYKNQEFKGTDEDINNLEDEELKQKFIDKIGECEEALRACGESANVDWREAAYKSLEQKQKVD